MNDDTSKAVEQQRKPKSKRLSSFIWILVLWGFVRLIAEMDGISWRRAWDGLAMDFGLYPASFLLVLGILLDGSPQRSFIRYTALAFVIASFGAVWVTVDLGVRDWIPSIQWLVVAAIGFFVFMKIHCVWRKD